MKLVIAAVGPVGALLALFALGWILRTTHLTKQSLEEQRTHTESLTERLAALESLVKAQAEQRERDAAIVASAIGRRESANRAG